MCTRLLSEEHTAGRDCMIFAGGTPGLREDKFSAGRDPPGSVVCTPLCAEKGAHLF